MASPASWHDGSLTDSTCGQRLLLLALIVTALAYLATLRFNFVYDDSPQIVLNSTLTSWRTLPGLFTSHSWKFLYPDWGGNYYRPLFMSWLLLNRKLFGLYAPAWHAATLLLHLVVTWLAFVVARQLLRSSTYAGFTALFFGLHPIHVEAVAWISGVTESLMAAFVLLAFWAWIKGERDPQRQASWKALAVLLYAASCLCKETGLLLPLVIVSYDVLQGNFQRDWSGLWRAAWNALPLWITAAAYLAVRAFVLHGLVHGAAVPWHAILLTIPAIFWGYMRRLVWPLHLSVFYDTPPVASPVQLRFWLPLLALAVAVLLAWRIGKRSHVVGLALIWIFVFLSPAIIGIPAFPLGEWIHDRYLYLPSFGFCLLLAHVISLLRSKQRIFGLPAVHAVVALLLAAVMAFATTYEEQYWSNDFLLFTHATRIAPDSAFAKTHLANEYYRLGDLPDTERLYQEALRIDPSAWKIHISYGIVLFYTGQYERADQQFAETIALGPYDSNPYFYQGLSRFNLGHYAAAEQAFRDAVRLGPKRPRYHFWLGMALEKEGRFGEAKSEYERELAEHPDTDTLARQHLQALKAGGKS